MLDYTKLILLLATCSVIIFSLVKLRRKNLKRDDLRFFLSSVFITMFLAFIIEIKPHHALRAELSISNLISYLFYFIIVAIYFLKHTRILLKLKYVLIIIAFLFFGLANVVDLLSDGQLLSLVGGDC